jgi:hypothetical protein
MKFKHIDDVIKEITTWKANHPGAFFHDVKCASRKLQYLIEAATDEGFKIFPVQISSILKHRVNQNQHRIIARYLRAEVELREAKEAFIKLFTSDLN